VLLGTAQYLQSSHLSRQTKFTIYKTLIRLVLLYGVIEKTPSPECPFCGVTLTTEHILWEFTETTREREEKPETRKRFGQMEQKE
jgi:hypothetical protein